MKTRRMTSRVIAQLMTAGAVSATLAACGGGGGDGSSGGAGAGVNGVGDIEAGVTTGDRDVNGDGVIDVSVGDIDGDGFEDFDIDGDQNFDTKLGDTNFDGSTDFDVNADGEADFDIDGDGTVDRSVIGEDGFLAGYDTNGNGEADVDTGGEAFAPTFIEPSAANPCGSQPSGDPDSSNFLWQDNCQVSQANQFATSQYTKGIQRIVWCSGFTGNAAANISLEAFADGIFGNNTRLAVEAFQSSVGETDDGVVGQNTWAALQDALGEQLEPGDEGALMSETGESFYDAYTIDGERCGGQALFYNQVPISQDGLGVEDPLGWFMAQSLGSRVLIDFTIEAP